MSTWVKAQPGVICTFKAHVVTQEAVFYQDRGDGKAVCAECAVAAGVEVDPEQTPLGRAAAAIRAAESALAEAYDFACGNIDCPVQAYSDCDVELRPDSDSLGFEAVYTYPESSGPPLDWLKQALSDVCREHGIVSIAKVGTDLDSSFVEGFKE